MHPLLGVDHVLAMLAVGIWGAQRGGHALWLLPSSFVLMMAAGGVAGFAGLELGMVELGIAASLVVLGLMVAAAVRPAVVVGMALVGVFAIFHGHAHAGELPGTANPLLYAVGFLLATALLHASGIGLCILAGGSEGVRRTGSALVRLSGLAVAGVGLLLISA
jgi:urease accessory protein